MRHSVDTLIDMSEKRKFGVDDIPWSLGVDRAKRWLPESLNPLAYLPSYSLLPEYEKLKVNQYYAAGLCEKFIFFESALSIALESLLSKKSNLPANMIKLMEVFYEEEMKHSDMFNRLANAALPEKYKGRDYYFLSSNYKIWLANNVIFKHPKTFIYWVWLGAYFEEKTVVFSQEYIKHRKDIDPLFYKVHKFHLLDEARHVEMERHFFTYFYDRQPEFKKKMALRMFKATVKSIQIPTRTLGKIFLDLQKDISVQNEKVYDDLLKEMDTLDQNPEYLKVLFGRSRFPIFQDLLSSHKEFSSISQHFV